MTVALLVKENSITTRVEDIATTTSAVNILFIAMSSYKRDPQIVVHCSVVLKDIGLCTKKIEAAVD